jgi:SAM-dependent methyltransferase
MCDKAGIEFGQANIRDEDVRGKSVIEVGSHNVNGTLRPLVEGCQPARYIGVDIQGGPGVDELCDVSELVSRFGRESFDLVISTELLEHVRDWRNAFSNLKNILRPNGILLITTRSAGFPYHGYPFDFWRYEVADMRQILADFSIESIDTDYEYPGVFVRARKPAKFLERDLSHVHLYSTIRRKRLERDDVTRLEIYLRGMSYLTRRVIGPLLNPGVKAAVKRRLLREKTPW